MIKDITKIIKEWKDEAGVEGIVLLSPNPESSSRITIYTDKPELMIALCEKYEEKLQEINHLLCGFSFVETGNLYVK